MCEMVAGSMAAMMLADAGASCIKVELPSGDRARKYGQQPKAGVEDMGAMFATLNRGKKGVQVDFSTAEGQTQLKEKILTPQKVDVIFVDAGAAADSVAAWAASNQAICVCITKDKNEFETQAASGSLFFQTDQGTGEKTFVNNFVNEKATACYAASAASAALFARGRGKGGQRIDVDMMGVAMHAGALDLTFTEMWMGLKEAPTTPNMTKLGGMTGFKSVGQIYQLSTSKDNKKFFAAALADAVSHARQLLTLVRTDHLAAYRRSLTS